MDSVPTARELAAYALAVQHPLTRTWTDDATRLDLLEREHDLDIRLAVDLDLAAQRAELVPGMAPSLLLNRWTAVTDDLAAMLSIRFEGGDGGLPFVDATPVSRPVRAGDVAVLTRAAAAVYGPLRPRYLRLWSAEPHGAVPGSGPDGRSIGGLLATLRDPARVPPPGLRLRRASSAAHHDEARDAYAAVDAAHPGHRAQATVESRADLEDACTRGMLFDVMAGGEWAGYVAADVEGRRLGLPAYVVQELVLAPPFRGRGYGTALSTLLARALPDDDRPVLLGTVHPDNRGALCAAVAAGRVDVGGWFRIVL